MTVVDLAQNVNWLGCLVDVGDVGLVAAAGLSAYPEIVSSAPRAAIADFVGLGPENIAFVNGSTEALFDIPLWRPERDAFIVAPTFWEYEFSARRAQLEVSKAQLSWESGFALSAREVIVSAKPQSLIFLCNPNNPTSSITDRSAICGLVDERSDSFVVVDETYLLFRNDFSDYSVTQVVNDYRNVLVVCSLSKFFAVPGLRAGFVAGHPRTIENYLSWRIPYSTPEAGSELASQLIANSADHVARSRDFYSAALDKTAHMMRRALEGVAGFTAPHGPFVLLRLLDRDLDHAVLVRGLLSEGFVVRDGEELDGLGAGWMRVKLADYDTMQRFCGCLTRLVGGS